LKVNIQNISNSKVLLINGELIDVLSGKKSKVDILIENGKIIEIGKIGKFENAEIIDCKNKIITQSFIDINSSFKTPGINDDEDLSSGSNAAMAGGYSKVCLMPDTNPIIDTPELVNFINNESKGLPITIYPIGAITKELKGQDLAELGLMHNAGAVALSNGKKTIMNGQVARYAMEYTKMFNIPFINHPECLNLVNNGYMNESVTSNLLGIAGNPSIAESIMVFRDLQIAKYVDGLLHIPTVSTSDSVKFIEMFKNDNTKVTAEVSPHHLFFNDEQLINFDSNLKTSPPIRSKSHVESLISGLRNGVIDCIASNHNPIKIDDKDNDFYHSKSGIIGLETAFSSSHTKLIKNGFKTETILNFFSLNPSKIMSLDLCDFKLGSNAELVIIDPNKKWIFSEDDIYSKSSNTPFIGQEFIGKICGTISKSNLFIK
tara:strand:- start:42818 stop:44113 length:1296 start_codon:yes stop_codon:yes gene_type:complete